MTAKKLEVLVAALLMATIAVGCTFTNVRTEESNAIPLTAEEVERLNKILEPLLFDDQGNAKVNPLSHFLTSYYDKPENIDLCELLRYFPSGEHAIDEAEFEALKRAQNWPFGADTALESMPVPIHKFPAATVNAALQKYMGITLDDLNGVGAENLAYLDEYDAYYSFTSDFAANTFACTRGERQGDMLRLFGETATLTLNKQGDDYLFISHQRSGGPEGARITVRIDTEANIPEAAIEYAMEYVMQQVDYYNYAGANLLPDMGRYAITDARISGLTRVNTGTATETIDIQMWQLEYRLLVDDATSVVVAGGMRMDEIDGSMWLTEWSSAGQPYLVMLHDMQADRWQRICVTNTDTITVDYGTPDMLERYGNEFTAAAMELYRQSVRVRTIGQVATTYTCEGKMGHTSVFKVAEIMTAQLLDDLKTEQADRAFRIREWENLALRVDSMCGVWIVTGEVDVRYEGILSPVGDSRVVPEGEYVRVSLGERHLKNENDVYILTLPSGEPEQAVLEPPSLSQDMSVGVGVVIDYVDDELLVFHGYFGLFGYDLKKQRITFAVDLKKAVGTTIIQGSEGAAVRVSADGTAVQLFFYSEHGDPKKAYSIDPHTAECTYGDYVPLSRCFAPTDKAHDRISHGTLGEITYTDGRNTWVLFSDWDWAN